MSKGFTYSIGVSVEKGAIQADRHAIAEALRTWPDCQATLTLEQDEGKRSSAANRYLWGKVYGAIEESTGQDKEDIHDEMCVRFTTETISYVNPATGEMVEMEVVRRTSGMKVSRFHKFVSDVKLFAGEFFCLTFEDEPEEFHKERERALAREAKKGTAA